MATPLSIPRIHSNGTWLADLAAYNTDAGINITAAMESLGRAAPNARDFYIIGPDAFREAQKQHEARMEKLRSVRQELELIIEGIMAQEPR